MIGAPKQAFRALAGYYADQRIGHIGEWTLIAAPAKGLQPQLPVNGSSSCQDQAACFKRSVEIKLTGTRACGKRAPLSGSKDQLWYILTVPSADT